MNSDLIKEGLRRPDKIPSFILSRIKGERTRWYKDDGVITFKDKGFAATPETRAEFCALNYHECNFWIETLSNYTQDLETVVEVGCGYGRLSPWIAQNVDSYHVIEPNEDVADIVDQFYPVEVHKSTADSQPFADGSIDAIFSRTVLQHIPPNSIDDTCREIQRILNPSGRVFLDEYMQGEKTSNIWPRSANTYAEKLQLECKEVVKGDLPEGIRDPEIAIFGA